MTTAESIHNPDQPVHKTDEDVVDPEEHATIFKELEDAFKVFDTSGSGFIKSKELKRLLTTTGDEIKEEEVDEMFKEIDIDKDGNIRYQQFIQVMLSK